MQINNPTLSAIQQAISLSSSTKLKTEGLTVGQQILARVVSAQSQGNVTLHINNTILTARSNLPLTQGQTLQLIVAQLGSEIILKPTQKAIDQALIQQNIRQTLPQEKPLKEVIQLLQQIARPTTQSNPALPAPVVQAVRQFLQNLPQAKDLGNSEGLKKALKEAGTFFESNLKQMANGKSIQDVGKDLKAMLLRLRDQLQQSQPQTSPPAGSTKPVTQTPATTQQQNQTSANPRDANATNQQQRLSQPPKPLQPSTTKSASQTTSQTTNQTVNQSTSQTTTTSGSKAPQLQNTQPATEKIPGENSAPKSSLPTHTAQANTPKQTQQAARLIQQTATRSSPQGGLPPLPGEAGKPAGPATQSTQTPMAGQTKPLSPQIISQEQISENSGKSQARQTTTVLQNAQNAVGELVKQVESALARTQLHQLNALNDMDGGKLAWSLELPLRTEEENVDVLRMRIYGDEEQKTEEGEIPLTVTIEVDLQYIGGVYAKITLLKDKVSIGFWAQESTTVDLFSQHIDELQTRLNASGLNTDNIACHHGPAPESHQPIPQTSGLLDVKA